MYFHMEPSENRPEVRKQLSRLVLIRATIFACGLLEGLLEGVEQKQKLKTHCLPKNFSQQLYFKQTVWEHLVFFMWTGEVCEAMEATQMCICC